MIPLYVGSGKSFAFVGRAARQITTLMRTMNQGLAGIAA